jgi:hypothetical protein
MPMELDVGHRETSQGGRQHQAARRQRTPWLMTKNVFLEMAMEEHIRDIKSLGSPTTRCGDGEHGSNGAWLHDNEVNVSPKSTPAH